MGLYPRRDRPLLRPCPAASTSCRQSPAGSDVPVASEQGTQDWGGKNSPSGQAEVPPQCVDVSWEDVRD